MPRKEGVGRHGKRLFLFWSAMATLTTPPPALPVCPSGGDPSPKRTRIDCTAQAAAQAVPDAAQTTQDTAHRHTRPDAGHAAPVCTQYQTGRAGEIRAAAGAGGRAQRVRNCADMDRTHRYTIANTKKCAMLHAQLDMNTKKCYYNARNKRTLKSVTPPQNRRTKP